MVAPGLWLNYWIRGLPLHQWGSIVVSPNKTIEELKDLIVQKSVTLSTIERSSIEICNVPEHQPVHDHFPEDGLGRLSISDLGEYLRGREELSGEFTTQPPKSQLHLVIDTPHLPILWWLRGSNSVDSFVVQCSKNDQMEDLKDAIRSQLASFMNINPPLFRLYKISTSDSELDAHLSEKGAGRLIGHGEWLRAIFEETPFSKRPRVVIEWVDENPFNPPPTRSEFLARVTKDVVSPLADTVGEQPIVL